MKTPRLRKIINSQAEALSKNPQQTARLLKKGAKLLQNPALPKKMLQEVKWMIQMIQASLRKEYPQMPWKTFVLLIGGVLYFVMPLDLIPDFIPITGWLDDMMVISGVAKGVSADIESFKAWKGEQRT